MRGRDWAAAGGYGSGRRVMHGSLKIFIPFFAVSAIIVLSGGMTVERSIQQVFAMKDKMEKQEKVERFRRLNAYVKSGRILFAGSSLIHRGS